LSSVAQRMIMDCESTERFVYPASGTAVLGMMPGSVAALTLKCAQSAHTAKRCQQQRSLCTCATRRTCRRIALDDDALGQVDFQE